MSKGPYPVQTSKGRSLMRDFLEASAEDRACFDHMREDFEYMMRHADHLPERHPEKASRRWRALEHFKKEHDL